MKLILLVMVLFLGCRSKDLTLPQRDLHTGMRLDGYYYRSYLNPINGISPMTNIVFLYKNGVVLDCFSVRSHDHAEMDEYIRRVYGGEYDKSADRLSWGIVFVDQSVIKMEQWYPGSGGPFPVYIKSGEILNDTTFRFNEIANQKGKERKALDQTYRFRRFSPKPDSTNNFVR